MFLPFFWLFPYNLGMKKKSSGQAVVEYLIFFTMMSIIAFNLVRAIHGFLASNIGGLAVVLSRQLKTGVCKETCFFDLYKNSIPDEE